MKKLYNQLKARKAAGDPLSFDALTDAQLYQLYIRENTIAPMIADLFGVSMRQFAERRRSCIGSTLRDVAAYPSGRLLQEQRPVILNQTKNAADPFAIS